MVGRHRAGATCPVNNLVQQSDVRKGTFDFDVTRARLVISADLSGVGLHRGTALRYIQDGVDLNHQTVDARV